jgi:hypothetical protein
MLHNRNHSMKIIMVRPPADFIGPATGVAHNSRMHWKSAFLACGLGIGCAVLSCGCQSAGKPESASFASVEIRGRNAAQIHETTVTVFGEHGYDCPSGGSALVFEKEGTRTDQVAYGGWMDEGRVKVRVRAEIVWLNSSTERLQCKAWMVRNAGSFFEDQKKLTSLSSGPFKKILNQIAQRLK